jgi:hypothetical protein
MLNLREFLKKKNNTTSEQIQVFLGWHTSMSHININLGILSMIRRMEILPEN